MKQISNSAMDDKSMAIINHQIFRNRRLKAPQRIWPLWFIFVSMPFAQMFKIKAPLLFIVVAAICPKANSLVTLHVLAKCR